ncbi:MAG: ATP-binding protein [Thermoguttaceae bacterium]|nr:ATP-binding protein [Thermoguttaceae bacterium]MDW8039318.1 ATP-binding protein [Thermoguttaceae bacterium]
MVVRHWPIRVKFAVQLGLLVVVVVILAIGGLYTTYAYRALAKTLSVRVRELPVAAELGQQVDDLQMLISELRGLRAGGFASLDPGQVPVGVRSLGSRFSAELAEVRATLELYRRQLEERHVGGCPITDTAAEHRTLSEIERSVRRVEGIFQRSEWMLDDVKITQLEAEVEHLENLVGELPSHLHRKLGGFAADVRGQYRALIVSTWVASGLAALGFGLFLRLFYRWIFVPLRRLIAASREVASGNFSYRVYLETEDEMAELAQAMNQMTERFEAIRDDLDRQVQERTRQVIRNEQLASVGFLAAGVAHEINNPLASIAMAAESMEERLQEALPVDHPERQLLCQYLGMIQREAFRCKEITEKLLDFSRTGPVRRQQTDLAELVQSVIEMVRHLGRYQGKQIRFEARAPVLVWVNPQEIKQVVLNLLTNALDSIDPGGWVEIRLEAKNGWAEICVVDNGCGMTPEVLSHIFEPFFTQKRSGQGTGLGLSISYRIIADHGGEIEAHSDGPGQGATFRVRLPMGEPICLSLKESRHQRQAA